MAVNWKTKDVADCRKQIEALEARIAKLEDAKAPQPKKADAKAGK